MSMLRCLRNICAPCLAKMAVEAEASVCGGLVLQEPPQLHAAGPLGWQSEEDTTGLPGAQELEEYGSQSPTGARRVSYYPRDLKVSALAMRGHACAAFDSRPSVGIHIADRLLT